MIVNAVLNELLDAVESEKKHLSVVKPSKKCKFARRGELEATLCIFAENQPEEGAGERDVRAYFAGLERSRKRREAEKAGSSSKKRKSEGKGRLCKQSEIFDFKY